MKKRWICDFEVSWNHVQSLEQQIAEEGFTKGTLLL